ncbi:MAG TPA: ABC transporter permease [Firmicutes bacterium]|nr:ABC transporter permease [Bacillota bacterium]
MHESTKKLSYPYIIWMAIMIIFPMVLIFLYSVTMAEDGNPFSFRFTLENYTRFFDDIYINTLLKSLWLAFISTLFCLGLGYPLAWIISQLKPSKQSSVLLLFVMPMWINMLLRTYAWLAILGKNGILNSFLGWFGVAPIDFLYTDFAVMLGMVYNFLPFMVLPIYTAIIKVDTSLIDAARDLGATNIQIFKKVIFPLTLPGIVTGIIMVFLPAVSSFVIPQLLGGGQYIMIGNLIEKQFINIGNWNFGSSLSILLMILILISIWVMKKFDSDGEMGGGSLPW